LHSRGTAGPSRGGGCRNRGSSVASTRRGPICGTAPGRPAGARQERRGNKIVTALPHGVTPPRRFPLRRNNAVTELLPRCCRPQELPQRRPAELGGTHRDACRGKAAPHRPGPVVPAPAAAAHPLGEQAAQREYHSDGRRSRGAPRQRLGSPAPARPHKTCTLQDLGTSARVFGCSTGRAPPGRVESRGGGTSREQINSESPKDVTLPARWERDHQCLRLSRIGFPSRNPAAGVPLLRPSGEQHRLWGAAPARADYALLAWPASKVSVGRGATTGPLPLFS
jgi:hypothetical protein